MKYEEASEKIDVVLIQPNIDPYTEKYNPENNNENIAEMIVDMSGDYVDSKTDYVIAPETALSETVRIDQFNYSKERRILQQYILNHPNLNIITGTDFFRLYIQKDRPTPTANQSRNGDWFDVYNAAVQLDNSRKIQYHMKSKLVVGVENFPFKSVLEPLLGDIMIDLGGTVLSRGIQKDRDVFTSKDKKYKAAPIICYESVYGEYVTEYVKEGANFLTIITNDAWWDNTQGHKQHLSYARLRAIENRKSIARSANTGISAFINERGDLLKTLPYDQKGVLKGAITANNKETLYVKSGDYIARVAALLSGFVLLFAIARKKH